MLTLAGPASALLEVKHSRFLAQAAPVESGAAALDWLVRVRDPAATHNCWAFRVGQDYRSSDDGERAGTAGRPILAAIDGRGVDGVAVVVTRWYGGIKLGAGGLVRAYGGCAAECLRLADKVERVAMATARVRFAFADTGAVHAVLAALGVERVDERFDGDGVELALRLPADRVPALKAQLRDATRDRSRLLDTDAA
ncbi:IMPACT family protein [Cognatilysobacter segetis]|uniref:IMPACT family protein n=1 Tax=Cognatilysobacter segetis TaxID=2492394 RepID=UPI00105CD7BD|nr:YigZ family protein [Lysobacter segetis]